MDSSVFAKSKVPRQIRTRMMTRNTARSRPAGASASADLERPTSPKSPVAVNETTGRMAMGPWAGAYESTFEEATERLIYLDREGSAHFDLADGMDVDGAAAGGGSSSALAAQPVPARTMQRDHVREISSMHSKRMPHFAMRAPSRRKGGPDTSQRVFQPRRFN